MGMRISSREKARPGRNAHRGLHKEMREVGAVRREAIEMWRLDQSISVGTDAIPAQLVSHDKDDVGPVRVRVGQSLAR